MTITLDYYNNNARQFADGTLNVSLTTIQNLFLSKLKENSYILDFGCGAGRDTKYFLSMGHMVDATDGSVELCKIAGDVTGIEVRQMYFQELDEDVKYDGIWACSSILHLSKEELKDVFHKMVKATKPNGVIYTSFKYGIESGLRNGRFFTDMTEGTFKDFLADITDLKIEEMWITSDARPGRGDEKWLNLILRKN